MRYYTNECVGCQLPCIYESCPYYKVEHFKCDFCGEEEIVLYRYDGYEICDNCLLKQFDIVGSNE